MVKKVGKKQKVNLTIDGDVWKLAKKRIPSVSQTIEDFLKVLIDLENANETKIVQEIAETEEEIKRSHGKLLILRDQLEKVRNKTRYNMKEQEENRAWRTALSLFRRIRMENETKEAIKKASPVLGVKYDVLVELLERVDFEVSSTGEEYMGFDESQIWENVKEKFSWLI